MYATDAPAMVDPFPIALNKFRDGSLTPRDYLEQRLEIISQREASLHAFAHLDLAMARSLADASTKRYREGRTLSAVDGLPFGVKDIIATARMPTQMNSALFRGNQPRSDATSVRALGLGGAVIVGKTATTELAIGSAATTVNPHDARHTPGGSSSGAAAAVGAGMLPASLGTQTQGSLVRPASFCGVVGYKPTWGALSLDGLHPVALSHDHLGVIADSIDTAWWTACCIAEFSPSPMTAGLIGSHNDSISAYAPRRLAVLRVPGYEEMSQASVTAFEALLDRLRGIGVQVVEPEQDAQLKAFCASLDQVPEWSRSMVAYEMQAPYGSYDDLNPGVLGPRIQGWLERARSVSRENYADLLRQRQRLIAQADLMGNMFDGMILPSAPGAAPAGHENTGSRTLQVYGSFLGIPACSLPLMAVDGLPYGCQLMDASNADYRMMCHARWMMGSLAQR